MLAASACKAALVEERLFLGRRRAAQDGVAMRETAKAGDNVTVDFGVFPVFRSAACKGRDAAILICEMLGMHQRQEEELVERRGNLAVEALLDGRIGDAAGLGVRGKRAGIVAEHVSRELVEHDDEGKRAFGRRGPVVAGAFRGRFISGFEPRLYGGVESVVLGVPFCGAGGGSEFKNFSGSGYHVAPCHPGY